ncbi:DUF5067 domain-containing protein [Lapidilactobacillus gannanensis]|uniref:DUF5067 domain-containing protein n=1 Tax=Lapidilactobacillus gannanensis TaxID=2486002 RepID=A0ABW4BK19_9LACO|nr:DUF5067 domain-containing protein [Lapidilactobacillus gannanensis]
MKKSIILAIMLGLSLTLAACGNSSDDSAKKSSEPKVEKASKVDSKKESEKSSKAKAESSKKAAASSKGIPTTDDKDWFFQDPVFYAGMETMTLTKSEVRDGAEDNTKVLVIYNTIHNNSAKEQDPSNFYMVIHAKQKTDTSNVDLDPGVLGLDANGNDPLQTQEDNLNNSLLPGKTVETVMMFKLVNSTPVTVEFSNEDFTTIGTKTYSVQ